MRVYIPATLTVLADQLADGTPRTLPPGPGYAVTPGLREWYADGDLEELEYAALSLAAEASVALLADDPVAVRRRVVVAADVDDTHLRVHSEPSRSERGRVEVLSEVPIRSVAAVHVDAAEATADVAASAADPGDKFAAGSVADHDLLWYASQEIDDLLADISG